ncbi:MAG TPA: GNAT family N-acetyltransferase [Firmicutes bacterium]|nr:GNAT family N-acetyltransferase [Bacillota bacterium]
MITARWTMGTSNMQDARLIRTKVFIEEQGFSEQNEFDDIDEIALHVIIYKDDKPCATGRLYYKQGYRIGRIAVLREERGTGLGDLTVRMLLFKAFEQEAEEVTVTAQLQAQGFYEKFGFAPTGEQTTDEGVPHVIMTVTPQTARLSGQCQNCANKEGCSLKNN